MLIKDISNIINKNIAAQINESNVLNFYKNCSIEEKIDSYYVNIDIVSNNIIKFKKSNKELSQVDLIINKNWSTFINDWKTIFNDNKELFIPLIGCRINLFYFPNSSPLSTYYKEGFRYIIKDVTTLSKQNISTLNIDYNFLVNFVGKLKIDNLDKSSIRVYKKLSFDNRAFIQNMQDKNINIEDYPIHVLNYINNDELFMDVKSSKAVENNVLELIFRNGKTLYQFKHKLNSENIERTTIEDEVSLRHKQLVFELVLQDFIEYASKDEKTKFKYIDLLSKNYVDSVNNIFIHYIKTRYEEENGLFTFLDSHFQPKDLTPPCLGLNPELNVDYIDNGLIKQMFINDKNKEWIINIYKVLLVNLKHVKKQKYIHYLSKNEINKWNDIVKSINIRISD